jgi:Uma2 family endonuclease
VARVDRRGALRDAVTQHCAPADRWSTVSRIGGYLTEHPVGEIVLAPFDVVFSQFDVVEPGLLYITAERRKQILTTQHVRGTPDLVIEVGSPGTRRRDETIKRRLYERSGVVEYWIVDPELEVIRVSAFPSNRSA